MRATMAFESGSIKASIGRTVRPSIVTMPRGYCKSVAENGETME